MDRTSSKSTLKALPSPPPLHSEDLGTDPTDPTAPPSLQTITHLALLLHAAKAEYTYWRARVLHLSTLLTEHKSTFLTSQSLSEAEAWELQLQADAEAQLLQDLDREAEMEVEAQLLGEAEERLEREAERQLLVEAGVVSEEEEGWRRVGITGRGKEGGMRKSRGLARSRIGGGLRNEESKVELGKVDEALEVVPEVNVTEVEAAQPPKTEKEVFEESHGKARWTRRRSLRRNMRTMGDLRSFSRLRDLQDTMLVSLPTLRRAEKEQEEYYRPPPPQENPEHLLPSPPQQAPPPEEPISPPPSPPLPPQQQEPHPKLTKPRAPFLTHAYTPSPHLRHISPLSKDQHQLEDSQSTPPPPYNQSPPSPPHSTAFTRAQSILLDLKSPLKGFINTYPYISAAPIFTTLSPPTLPTPPSSSSGPASSGENPPSALKQQPTSKPPPRRHAPAKCGFLQGGLAYEAEVPPTPQMRTLKRDSTSLNGHGNAGYARILETKSSRRYVKDEKWGWRAV
ncbi:hypothetical protein BGX38DRAFT_1314060 [Terfezia claveryi]|nr:hypothetical protein BGX38DRAFT_1314060 [Terfezia claveryi]